MTVSGARVITYSVVGLFSFFAVRMTPPINRSPASLLATTTDNTVSPAPVASDAIVSPVVVVASNKETGTVTVAIQHKDSALARIIAARVVDSASQIFVTTSRAQAQQLRIAQEARVAKAAAQLASAEERLRSFTFSNRAAPPFSDAGLERERLNRIVQLAEQVYTQAATDRESAYAQELQETPTVVVQDPLPSKLPKVRKRIVMKTIIAGIVSLVLISLIVLTVEVTRKRLDKRDSESERFRRAMATLPRIRRKVSAPAGQE